MKLLSRSEEIILLAVLKLEGNAYGITIKEQVETETHETWSFGSIYMPLNKLTRKGFVQKWNSEPVQERGGRSRCYYLVTEEGRKALLAIRRVNKNIWSRIPGGAFSEDE